MVTKLLKFIPPLVYIGWAVHTLDIPAMPYVQAADVGMLGVWAFQSLNLAGGLVMMALVRICWTAHFWFFSPSFQHLGRVGFVALVAIILLTGILQWLGVGFLIARFYRAVRQPRPLSSKQT